MWRSWPPAVLHNEWRSTESIFFVLPLIVWLLEEPCSAFDTAQIPYEVCDQQFVTVLPCPDYCDACHSWQLTDVMGWLCVWEPLHEGLLLLLLAAFVMCGGPLMSSSALVSHHQQVICSSSTAVKGTKKENKRKKNVQQFSLSHACPFTHAALRCACRMFCGGSSTRQKMCCWAAASAKLPLRR